MSSIVLDVEGFAFKSGVFIAKELAVCDVLTGRIWEHHVFKPPFNFSELSAKEQDHCHWITHNLHGIHWTQGETDYTELNILLRDLQQHFEVIYVKGLSEKTLLMENFGLMTVDLDQMDCPRIDTLREYFLSCNAHVCIRQRKHCALEKAVGYTQWVRDYREL